MNVRDLKLLLDQFDDDAEVMVSYPSGDYWHTTLAKTPDFGTGLVVMSEYHGRLKVTDDIEEGVKEVVLL